MSEQLLRVRKIRMLLPLLIKGYYASHVNIIIGITRTLTPEFICELGVCCV